MIVYRDYGENEVVCVKSSFGSLIFNLVKNKDQKTMLLPHHLFQKVAQENPNAIALMYLDENNYCKTITYRELEEKCNKLANYLRTVRGLKPKDIVGICLNRGNPNIFIAMLALWKTGLTYMPLSCHFDPKSKLDAILLVKNRLTAAGASFVITQEAIHEHFKFSYLPNCMVDCDADLINQATTNFIATSYDLNQIAYICCSSGTTSQPKMIANDFDHLTERVLSLANVLEINSDACLLGFSAQDFDASIMDALLALLKGASLVLVPQGASLSLVFDKARRVKAITTAILVPSVVKVISHSLDKGDFQGLNKVLTMGEACEPRALIALFKYSIRVYTGYGPTEAKIAATGEEIFVNQVIPLGKPLAGVEFFIKTDTGKIIAYQDISTEEMTGELCIGGIGLGCYWKDEQRNSEKFLTLTSPYSGRVYTSGDRIKCKNGSLFFEGRLDREIKRQGKKTNLDDIERMLQESQLLRDVAVVEVDQVIIAYIIPQQDGQEFDQEILDHISACNDLRLHPNFCVKLTSMPLTARDKIDRNNLDKFKQANPRLVIAHNHHACETVIEKAIANIWFELLLPEKLWVLLGVQKQADFFTVHQDFYELGGTSLLIMVMIEQVWNYFIKSTGSSLAKMPDDLFPFAMENRTINAISRYLETLKHNPIKKYHAAPGLPIFFIEDQTAVAINTIPSFANGNLVGIKPLINRRATNKNEFNTAVAQIIRAILSCQRIGPFLVAVDHVDVKLALAVKEHFAWEGEEVYLCVINDGQLFNSNIQELTANQLKVVLQKKLQQLHRKTKKQQKESLPKESHKEFSLSLVGQPSTTTLNQYVSECLASTSILILAGLAGCGKTFTSYQLYDYFWTKFEASGFKGPIPIHLKLTGENKKNIIQHLLLSNGLTTDEMHLLKTYEVVFICDDYLGMARYEFPDLWQENALSEWKNVKLILTSRELELQQGLTQSWKEQKYLMKRFAPLNLSNIADDQLQSTIEVIKQDSLILTPQAFFVAKQLLQLNHVTSSRLHTFVLNEYFSQELARHYEISGRTLFEDFQKFLEYIRSFNNFFAQGLPMRFLPSKWENKRGFKSDNERDIRNNYYFPILKAFLSQEGDRMVLAPWIKKISNQYDVLQIQSSHSQPLTEEEMSLDNTRIQDQLSTLSLQEYKATVALQYFEESTPIFLFHPLTGEVPRNYRLLSQALGENQTVYAFRMGDNDASSGDLSTNLQIKAKFFTAIISKIYPRGKIILAGWSFGFIVSLAVARILEQQKREVALIMNIDFPGLLAINQIKIEEKICDLVKTFAEEIYELPLQLQRLIADEFQASKLSGKNDTLSSSEKIDVMFELLFKLLEKHANDYIVQRYIKALQHSRINLKTWYESDLSSLKQLNSPIIIIRASEKKSSIYEEGHFEQWQQFTQKPLVIQETPGNHFNLFRTEFFNYVRKIISEYQPLLLAESFETRLNSYLERSQSGELVNVPTFGANSRFATSSYLLEEKLSAFLNSKNQYMLILGASGAGKTFFIKSQVENRSKLFKNAKYLAIYLEITKMTKESVYQAFADAGFTRDEVDSRLSLMPIVFFIDGLKETDLQKNLDQLLGFNKWNSVKIVLGCQSNNLTEVKHDNCFSGSGELVYIPPFNEVQIGDYFTQYRIKVLQREFNYQKELKKYPGMLELISSPITLAQAAQILPQLPSLSLGKDPVQAREWTRTDFYAISMRLNFNSAKVRLNNNQGTLPGVSLDQAFLNYSTQLALAIYFNENLDRFVTEDLDTILVRQVAPVDHHSLAVIAFRHMSYQEYFVACGLVEELLDKDPIYWKKKKIVGENSIILFIVERINQLPEELKTSCIYQLFALVFATRVDKSTATKNAATNAITLLNKLNIAFNGMDLSGLDIEGSDLLQIVADNAWFVNTNLNDVRLARGSLRKTNFSNASMKNTDLGELSYITTPNIITYITYSPNNEFIAVGCGGIEITKEDVIVGDCGVYLYDNNQVLVQKIDPVNKSFVSCIAFSPNNNLLICAWQNDLGVYQLSNGLYTLSKRLSCSRGVRQIQFIHKNNEFYLVSNEGKLSHYDSNHKLVQQSRCDLDMLDKMKINHSGTVLAISKHLFLERSRFYLYSLESEGTLKEIFLDRDIACHDIAFSYSDLYLVIATNEADIIVWDIRNEKIKYEFKIDIDSDVDDDIEYIMCLAFSYDDKFFAGGSTYGRFFLWELETGTRVNIPQFEQRVNHIEFSPNNHWVALGGKDCFLMQLDITKITPSFDMFSGDLSLSLTQRDFENYSGDFKISRIKANKLLIQGKCCQIRELYTHPYSHKFVYQDHDDLFFFHELARGETLYFCFYFSGQQETNEIGSMNYWNLLKLVGTEDGILALIIYSSKRGGLILNTNCIHGVKHLSPQNRSIFTKFNSYEVTKVEFESNSLNSQKWEEAWRQQVHQRQKADTVRLMTEGQEYLTNVKLSSLEFRAVRCFQNALKLLLEFDPENSQEVARIRVLIGKAYLRCSIEDKALSQFSQALSLFHEGDNKQECSSLISGIMKKNKDDFHVIAPNEVATESTRKYDELREAQDKDHDDGEAQDPMSLLPMNMQSK